MFAFREFTQTEYAMNSDGDKRSVSFRLAWRWKESGVSGSTPWMARGETVEAWLESFERRSGGRVEHWIEVSDAGSEHQASANSRITDRQSTRDRS